VQWLSSKTESRDKKDREVGGGRYITVAVWWLLWWLLVATCLARPASDQVIDERHRYVVGVAVGVLLSTCRLWSTHKLLRCSAESDRWVPTSLIHIYRCCRCILTPNTAILVYFAASSDKFDQTVLRERKPPPRRLTLTKSDPGLIIQIQISGLIPIRIQMSAGSVPKCCGFSTLSASVISPSVLKMGRWLYEKCKSLFANNMVDDKKQSKITQVRQ